MSVEINKETVVVYSITLPGDPEPIVLRVPGQVAEDLWQELDYIFAPPRTVTQADAPIAPVHIV